MTGPIDTSPLPSTDTGKTLLAEPEVYGHPMFEAMTRTVTIDGAGYHSAALAGNARMQVTNPQATDQGNARLRRQSAIDPTAHTAYAHALKEGVPGQAVH